MSNWSRDLYGLKNLSEVSGSVSISSNTLTLDLSTATTFKVTLNADINTLTINNGLSPGVSAFTLIFIADGTARTVTWGSAIHWAGGTPPTLTNAVAKCDVFTFVTLNATTWLGFTAGQNYLSVF